MQARPIALMEGVKHNSIGARAVGWIFNGADPVRRNRAFSVIANRRDDRRGPQADRGEIRFKPVREAERQGCEGLGNRKSPRSQPPPLETSHAASGARTPRAQTGLKGLAGALHQEGDRRRGCGRGAPASAHAAVRS